MSKGLAIEERLTRRGEHPFDACEWVTCDVEIRDHTGNVTFEQKACEFPAHFSELSRQIVASKYFRGKLGTPERETSLRQVIGRVVDRIAGWGEAGGVFATGRAQGNFSRELAAILLHQYGCFNSPVWFNLGVPGCAQQASACFILEAEDTLDGWFRLAHEEGKIFKSGSGSGVNLSRIRSSKDWLSGGGRPSGPLSTMSILDVGAGQIKSGGVTRRAAKMHVLDITHPDLLQTREGLPGFVWCKLDQERAAHALIAGGYDGGFNVPGGAYSRVFYQNANHSVRAGDDFFAALEAGADWALVDRFGNPVEIHKAGDILQAIAEATHCCGDPGMQYAGNIARWHTLPNTGEIEASNPCSEYLSLNNTSCNLASIRLTRFLKEDGTVDVPLFRHVTRILIIAMEIIVGGADYPTEAIDRETRRCRNLGLGYCDLGAALMQLGLPYDSEPGRQWAGAVTSLMTATAYAASVDLAWARGPFHYFEANREPMLRVIGQHRAANTDLADRAEPSSDAARLAAIAGRSWAYAVKWGARCGFRNSQTTVIAPTGTIAFFLGADTTGIEPDIALAKTKELAGGGRLVYLNGSVPAALYRLGYTATESDTIVAYLKENGHLEGCEELAARHLPVFDCAFQSPGGTRSIAYTGHLLMMAAVQPFVSGAISKTINMPNSATVAEVARVYVQGHQLGLKAVALYRDGSKGSQPLSAGGKKRKKLPKVEPLTCPNCGREAAPDQSEKCFACSNCGFQLGCSV
jgi:ribonucleoside-diphosphate reductase alpha chain